MTTGIYKYSRNPQFLGWFLVLLGISLIGRSGLAFVLTGVFAVVIHLYTTRMEEPYLERLYGEEYCLYKSRSARYIRIPKEGKKEHITNFISIIVSASILILTIIFKNQFDSGVFLQIIGLFIGITGLILWITGRVTLGKYFTISYKPKGFITKGIYARVRHPMYSGGILLYLGLGLFFKSIIGIVLTVILLAPLLIYSAIIEERLLVKKYGEKYVEYKKKTIF